MNFFLGWHNGQDWTLKRRENLTNFRGVIKVRHFRSIVFLLGSSIKKARIRFGQTTKFYKRSSPLFLGFYHK